MKWFFQILLCFGAIVQSVFAAAQTQFEVARVEYQDYLAEGIEATLDLDTLALQFKVDRLLDRSLDQQLDQISGQCILNQAFLSNQVTCSAGSIRIHHSQAGQWDLSFELSYERDSSRLLTTISTEAAGGELTVQLVAGADGYQADVSMQQLSLSMLLRWLDAELVADLADGLISGQINLEQSGEQAARISGQAQLEQLGFDTLEGRFAAAELDMLVDFSVISEARKTPFDLTIRPVQGALLLDTLYLEFSEEFSPELALKGVLGEQELQISEGRYEDSGTITTSFLGDMDVSSAELKGWSAEAKIEDLSVAYERYIKEVLFTLGAGEYVPSGKMELSARGANTQVDHATLNLVDVSMQDLADRFSFERLDGLIDYDLNGDSFDSQISWETASVYKLPIGASELRFFIGGREFQLLSGLNMPLLDGQLNIAELAISGADLAQLRVDFEAELMPVSLEELTTSLELLPLQGRLSGKIPRVTLRDGVLEVGGAMKLEVFDGEVTLDNLRLERLFGVLPNFSADMTIDNIELEQLTGAFSFGKIEGRLDGHMSGLRLLAWRPVAFDLSLQTPEKDRSKRRISQRAVENLSSIGGASAALSRTFLGFFDDFGYRRIGLSCKLHNNVCEMGGAGPGPNGSYYIVEGSGVPRINVLGFAREVDFPQLLAKLQAVAESGGDAVID